MKTPDEINMNAENAFVLREAAKAHSDGYYEHLSHGGKGDPAEERWIEALNAGADALAYIQQLEREKAALMVLVKEYRPCWECIHRGKGLVEPCLHCDKVHNHFEWRGVKEPCTGASDGCTGASGV